MTGDDVDASVAFLADLNRLLREGLVRIEDPADEDEIERYRLTPRGTCEVRHGDEQPDDDQSPRNDDPPENSIPETTQRRTG